MKDEIEVDELELEDGTLLVRGVCPICWRPLYVGANGLLACDAGPRPDLGLLGHEFKTWRLNDGNDSISNEQTQTG